MKGRMVFQNRDQQKNNKKEAAPGEGAASGDFVPGRLTGDFVDVDEAAVIPAAGKSDGAVGLGEERVVVTTPDVDAGVKLGAALADDDRAGGDGLPTEHFHTEHLRVGIAAVSG